MKWLVTTLILLGSTLVSGKQKTIELIKGVVLYLIEDNLNPLEFSINPKILNVGNICFIDNNVVFGTDFELPKTKLTSAYIIYDNKKVSLDISSMYNPNIQSLTNKLFKTEKIGDKLVITGLFSDGAGSFLVQWIVINKSSVRTIISSDENVYINLFYGPQSTKT
jgi:hypothetical protein